MKNEFISSCIGTGLAILGTATQVNEMLQTISLIITILGAIVSFIIVPLLSWYRNAKKDGKITLDEAAKGADTLKEGLEKTKEALDEERREDNGKIH